MNTSDKKSKATGKLIAAGITMLLGIILAIGYPTGGVKANKTNTHKVVEKTVVQHNTNTTQQTVVKKEKPKKRRVIPVAPPRRSDDSQDEGC